MHELTKRIYPAIRLPFDLDEKIGLDKIIVTWLEEKCKSYWRDTTISEKIKEHFGLSKKMWCEHIKQIERGKSSSIQGHYWGYYRFAGAYPQNICEEWNACPVCGKKRPEGDKLGGGL